MTKEANRRYKRRKNIPYRYIMLAVVLTAMSVMVGAGVFFEISDIEVIGNEKYTDEMVIETSGLKTGSRLYAVSKSVVELNICKKLSFIEDAEIELIYPNKVSVTVSESYPIAAVFVQGDWWVLDKNARLLEFGSQTQADSMIVISGLTPSEGTVGSRIELESDEMKLGKTTQILAAILASGLENDIRLLDISDMGNITLKYGAHVTIKLGSAADAAGQLELFKQIAGTVDNSVNCTVDLTVSGEAFYTRQ